MRSAAEIRFRLGQEIANLRLFAFPPAWGEPLAGPLLGMPELPAQDVVPLAEELLAHRFRLLGLPTADLGPEIRWRRDFLHGRESGTEYFRRIPYLDFQQAGDHKVIWELNRHQHLVVLAQAFVSTGRREFLNEIPRQLDHWMRENPVQRGINWASALEVAFRAMSWMWVLHLVGRHFDEAFRGRWMRSLNHHGLHLEHNLSFYFSPNTHLMGEAVALDAMGRLLPEMPRAHAWRKLGAETVLEQMRKQVRDDGTHYEQSSYYHRYSVDFFRLHAALNPEVPGWYREKLLKMEEFLAALVSCKGVLPLIGDDDGGRLLGPSSTPCGVEGSRWFADAGVAVMRAGRAHVIVDVGKFGRGSAGHSHADTLSMVVFLDGEELLIDPGTFTYIADPEARQRFRGVAAHNTVSIDGLEQAVPQGPFRWSDPPEVELLRWSSSAECDILEGCCSYRGFTHRRSMVFRKPEVLVVVDRVSGPAGSHRVEQRWLAPEGTAAGFIGTLPTAVAEAAERSVALGSKEPAVRWVARYEGELPTIMVAVFRFDGGRAAVQSCRETTDGGVIVEFEGGEVQL